MPIGDWSKVVSLKFTSLGGVLEPWSCTATGFFSWASW